MGKLLQLFAGIYRDAWGFAGLIAPALSIVVSILKLLAVNMDWLQELSWGWVFAPITAWLLVAYIRRWKAYQSRYEIDPEPNWSARDAFRYVMLNSKWALGRNPDDKRYYNDIDGELVDAAKLGRIKVWARPRKAMSGGFSEAIHEFEKKVWTRLHFDLPSCISLVYDNPIITDYEPYPWVHYEDSQVNREQFLTMWPRANWFERWRDPQNARRLEFDTREQSCYAQR